MKKLIVDDGLLLTDIELIYNDASIFLKRVLVDTGSGGTIVSTDLAETIGIIAEENDVIYRISGVGGSEFVFSKRVDAIKMGFIEVHHFAMEFGAMDYGYDLDGSIGLDFLQQVGAVINLEELTISAKVNI